MPTYHPTETQPRVGATKPDAFAVDLDRIRRLRDSLWHDYQRWFYSSLAFFATGRGIEPGHWTTELGAVKNSELFRTDVTRWATLMYADLQSMDDVAQDLYGDLGDAARSYERHDLHAAAGYDRLAESAGAEGSA